MAMLNVMIAIKNDEDGTDNMMAIVMIMAVIVMTRIRMMTVMKPIRMAMMT